MRWQPIQTATCGVAIALVIVCGPRTQGVDVAAVFSDHAVLQRDRPVPVWGTGIAGQTVTVSFRQQRLQTTVASDGGWSVELAPLAAGGPDDLVITGDDTRRVTDVLVGEVWMAAGQSNMAVGAGGAIDKGDEAMAALVAQERPRVRVNVWQNERATWRIATTKQAASMPGTAYAFAARLADELDVPVGVLVRAVPGSATDFWITAQMLQEDAACRDAIAAYAKTTYPALQQAHAERRARWQADPGERKEPEPPTPPGEPQKGADRLGRHFEGLIRPLVPFAVRGFLWDQGENMSSIAGAERSAVNAALVRGWRATWKRDDLPFLYVQKPSGGGCAWDPSDPLTCLAEPFAPLPAAVPKTSSGFHRDMYLRLLQVPGTALVMSSDLGGGLHPVRKSSYGTRAARVALTTVYGRPGESCGPLYHSHQIDGERIRIRFSHLGGGLAARHAEALQGFAIADASRTFVWATAVIDGDSVVVHSPQVRAPVAVRYAWADEIPWANLFSREGLPAQAFRTDDW